MCQLAASNLKQGDFGLHLDDYLRVLRRNWLLIVASALIGLLLGGAASILTKPTYTSETQLFVSIQGSGTVQELQQGNTFSQARVQSYVKIVNSPLVLQPAIDSLGLTLTAEELSEQVTATTDVNTVLINIAVKDSSPVHASAIAQAVGKSLIATVDALEKPGTVGTSPVSLSITKPAKAPASPSAPNTKINLMLGLVVGLMLGMGCAVLRSVLDSRVRNEADLRRVTDAPILGGIAFDQEATKRPLLTQASAQSPRAESFRQLRTNLQFANVSGHAKSVLVTSSVPGEGKSTTATNLAIALAQAGQTVCLVDADLRHPMVNDYLGLDRGAGLTTALVGTADVNDLLQPWGEDNLYVLASGQIPPNPSELLGSKEMGSLMERLEQAFDIVIVDAPPLLPVTDAAVLSQHVGGVVVVVGSQRLRHQELQKALDALKMVGAVVLGIVMNRLPAKGPDAYAYTYYGADEAKGKNTGGRSLRKPTASMRQSHMTDEQEESTGSQYRSATKFPVGRSR